MNLTDKFFNFQNDENNNQESIKDEYFLAIDSEIDKLKENIDSIEKLKTKQPSWTHPIPMNTTQNGISGIIGCYKVIYKLTNEVMGIGTGVVANRRTRHLSVFKNDGVDIIHPNGTSSGSALAGYMYKFDSNIDNWLFSWCEVNNKYLAASYEYFLQKKYNPQFNKLEMAGK